MTFPGVTVNLNLGQANAPPATGGSVGSVVNHVGFVVKNVQESVAKWKAAGVPVEPGNNGRLDQAYVNTPDGLRIEILEDKNQSMPIRSEHEHFFVMQSEIPKIQAWYAKTFGAKPGTRNNAPIDDIPGDPVALQQGRRRAGADEGARARSHRIRRGRSAGFRQEARSGRHQARSSLHQERNRRWARLHHRPLGHLYRDQRAPKPVYLP